MRLPTKMVIESWIIIGSQLLFSVKMLLNFWKCTLNTCLQLVKKFSFEQSIFELTPYSVKWAKLPDQFASFFNKLLKKEQAFLPILFGFYFFAKFLRKYLVFFHVVPQKCCLPHQNHQCNYNLSLGIIIIAFHKSSSIQQ